MQLFYTDFSSRTSISSFDCVVFHHSLSVNPDHINLDYPFFPANDPVGAPPGQEGALVAQAPVPPLKASIADPANLASSHDSQVGSSELLAANCINLSTE